MFHVEDRELIYFFGTKCWWLLVLSMDQGYKAHAGLVYSTVDLERRSDKKIIYIKYITSGPSGRGLGHQLLAALINQFSNNAGYIAAHVRLAAKPVFIKSGFQFVTQDCHQ